MADLTETQRRILELQDEHDKIELELERLQAADQIDRGRLDAKKRALEAEVAHA